MITFLQLFEDVVWLLVAAQGEEPFTIGLVFSFVLKVVDRVVNGFLCGHVIHLEHVVLLPFFLYCLEKVEEKGVFLFLSVVYMLLFNWVARFNKQLCALRVSLQNRQVQGVEAIFGELV